MRRRNHPSQSNSGASPNSTSAPLAPSLPGSNLGDKLYRLAQLSPKHVRAVEMLVDLMLMNLEPERPPGRIMWVMVPVVINAAC